MSPQPTSHMLLHLLLPGCYFPMAADLINPPTVHHINSIRAMHKWPALLWGNLEHVVVTDTIYSFARWVNGKLYDRFLVIVNFGNRSIQADFVKKLEKFTVPAKGRVVLSVGGADNREASVIDVHALDIAVGELLVIQFPPFGI